MYKVEEMNAKIRLNANELNMPMTETVIEDIMKTIDMSGFNRYPETDSQSLKKAYADFMAISEEDVLVGNGSDEVLDILYKTFTTYGDKIMSLSPSFVMYELMADVYKCKYVPYVLNSFDGFDVSDFINAINKEKPRMVFLCNPNNPTGLLISKSDILKIIRETDSLIIVDEAYGEFISDNYRDYSLIDERDNFDRLVILKTLSKAYGLAGLRVGFGIANKNVIAKMAAKKYPYNVSLFSQQFAQALITRAETPFFTERIKQTIENRDAFIAALKAFESITVFPTAANFVWLYAPDVNLKAICDAASIQIRVFTTEKLRGYVRISIGTKEEMNTLLQAMKEA
jgi:histidinol-phosphate aminotransferase